MGELKKGQSVTINIPFTYTIGEEGFHSGKTLLTIEDCKDEVLAEIEADVLNSGDEIFLEVAPIVEEKQILTIQGVEYDLTKAAQLLSYDSDYSTAAMVTLINENEDENELIDYVDNVNVWEKVEYSFTCGQFMQEIKIVK